MVRNAGLVLVCICLLLMAADAVCAAKGVVEMVVFQSDEQLYQDFFDAFERKTGIRVEPQWYVGNQVYKWEQTITRIAGGVPPDVVSGTSSDYVAYAAQGLLEPLDSYITRDKVQLQSLVPMMLQEMKWQGHMYQMPYGASAEAMAYDIDMFEKGGVAPPPATWSNPNWTWDSALSAARKLTTRTSDGIVTQWGFSQYYWLSVQLHWGADYVDDALQNFTGLDERVLDSWQTMQDLTWRYEVQPRPGAQGAANAALHAYASYSLQRMVESEQRLAYASWFRVGHNPPVGTMFPMGLSLLRSAPNKENGWELLKFATLDPEGNLLWNMAAGSVPGMLQVHPRWLTTMEEYRPYNIHTFIDLVTKYPAIEKIRRLTGLNQIIGLLDGAWNSVMSNEKSPRQALTEIADAANEIIRKGQQ